MHIEPEEKPRISRNAVFRAGLLLLSVVLIFIIVRQYAVPKSFGQYGYYRGDNVQEWVSLDQNFAQGNQACGGNNCHVQAIQQTAQGSHGQLNCQSCHGPLLAHAKNPKGVSSKVAGNADLCGACHRELIGRSRELVPTVKVGEHSGGLDCTRCHNAHQPLPTIGGSKQ